MRGALAAGVTCRERGGAPAISLPAGQMKVLRHESAPWRAETTGDQSSENVSSGWFARASVAKRTASCS